MATPRSMLLVSFGSPSAISYAVTTVVRHAMARCIGDHEIFQVVYLDDFKTRWHESGAETRRAVLVVSDCPQTDVIDLFAATKGPILVSCDSFQQIVDYVMRSRDMAFAPAVRFASQVVCALEMIAQAPNVMRITPQHYEHDLAGFAAALVAFTGMECSEAQFEAVMATLQPESSSPRETFRDYVERNFPHFAEEVDAFELSAHDRASLQVLANHYSALVENRVLLDVVWPTNLFLDWDRPGRFLERPIELLGPARFIICGPYLHLPRGRWRMSVELETGDCFSDNQIGADVFSGRILSAAIMKLAPDGIAGFDLDFEVINPLLPVELRVQLMTGAIEGTLRLLDVRLSRKPLAESIV